MQFLMEIANLVPAKVNLKLYNSKGSIANNLLILLTFHKISVALKQTTALAMFLET